MSEETISYTDRVRRPIRETGKRVLKREIAFKDGHFILFLFGCIFSANIAFWFINGALDFSVGIALGSINDGDQVITKILAYLLLIPAFLFIQIGYYYLFHREQIRKGQCPSKSVVTLDWFAVGILATSFPLALQNLGAWTVSGIVYGLGIFVLPRYVDNQRLKDIIRVGFIIFGFALYVYIVHGTKFGLPPAEQTLGPMFSYVLEQEYIQSMMKVTNSFLTGPVVVGLFAIVNNIVLTSQAVYEVPLIRQSVPERQSILVVFNSAAIGTVFYLIIKGVYQGGFSLIP